MYMKNYEKLSIHSKIKVEMKCDLCNSLYVIRYDSSCIQYEKLNKHRCRSCSRKNQANKLRGIKRPQDVIDRISASHIETNKDKYPNFTITCKCCNKEFKVPYRDRDRQYCNRSCQSKSISRTDIRNTSDCIVCKKSFKHYGERILCSRKCASKYMSITRFGQNNPRYKDKQKRICLSCQKEFSYDRGGLGIGRDRMFCSLACSHSIDVKSFTLNSKSGYPREWNEKLKKSIKERDNYECQLCSSKGCSLHVHHIDYDKTNLEKENLITLCQKCHNATHNGRTFWEIIFSGIISGSKLVKKPWGGEIHIVNNNDYCLKYLIFFKNKQFSFHVHNIKRELWHCLYGRLECVLQKGEVKDYLIFKQGDKIQIERGVIHQLQAIRNSILVEVSTKDYPEDSIRLIEGIN